MLEKYRKQIDKIDNKLIKLFEKRMDVAKKVGEYKKENGMEIFCPDREKSIIEKRTNQTKNADYKRYSAEFFESLMRISRRLQGKILNKSLQFDFVENKVDLDNLKVVYPGVSGSYSGEALDKYFPHTKEKLNVNTFLEVAKMVSNGDVNFGILPFENNSSGAISHTLDLIYSEKLYICGETYIDIRHCLLGTEESEISDIKEIYSHNQGFLQSDSFINTMDGEIKLIPMDNTAIAAKYVSETNDKTKAAIASKTAAREYKLKILREDINENVENKTRFVVVSNKLLIDDKSNKISAAFTAGNKSGALCDILAVFAAFGVNLLHIESRPLKEKDFSYIFYIDFEGNIKDENVIDAISQIKQTGANFFLLGNYEAKDYRE